MGICLFFVVLFLASCQKEELAAPKDYAVTCYAATFGKGIYKSDNGGISWFPINADQQVIHSYFKRLYKDPLHLDILYIATTGAGLLTLNLKSETLNKEEQFNDEYVRGIAFQNISSDTLNALKIFVGLNGRGIYCSNDPFKDWETQNAGLFYHDINVLFTQKDIIFTGTERGLFKWNKTANQWEISSEGIKNKNIYSMNADPEGKALYAGVGRYGGERSFFEDIPCLYKSNDLGITWEPSDKGLPEGTLIYSITINPNHLERIYLGTSDGIYRSVNSGRDWQKMTEGLPKDLRVYDIKIARMSDGNDVIYAAGSKGVFMTEDNSQTFWTNKSFGLEPTAITGIVLISD
jgi:hypothetical protein